MRMARLLVVVAIAVVHVAAAPWTLTTADFEKQQVDLRSIGADGVVVQGTGSGQPRMIAMGDFLGVARSQPPQASQAKPAFTLHLSGGDRLVGAPAGITGETLAWKSDAIGEVPVSIRAIAGMTRGTVPLPHQAEPLTADRVRLANGDVIEGVIADISGEGVAVTVGGEIVPVPVESIVSIALASGSTQPRSEPGFQVRLADGSIIGGSDLTSDGQSLTFTVAGEPRTLPLASVRSIDQVNGPVAWVSDLPPVQDLQTPFIGDAVPSRFNTTLDGKPITVGDRRFMKGIAVHTRSVLSFDLPPGFETFRTQYAIEGDRPQANVVIRVKLDGKIVHEQPDVTAGRVYPVVSIPLGGAKRLTLEADYGQTYDVQDRLLWIEPALVR